MKPWVRLFIFGAALLAPGLARADVAPDFKSVIKSLRAMVPVPSGWDGIWDHTDSVYICGLGALPASRDTDTTCVDQSFEPPIQGTFSCTGSSTTTTFHVECTGTIPFDVGCDINATSTYDGTRTGSTYYAIGQVDGVDSPPGCAGGPICLTIHVHATRLGDAPPAYCATPTLPRTWGNVKATYR